MIRAVYERGKGCLRAEGHAGSAPYGQDLVCAGVSVLMLTAQRMAGVLEREDAAVCRSMVVQGLGSVQCLPAADRAERVQGVLDTVAAGLELLAESFPDCVEYREE